MRTLRHSGVRRRSSSRPHGSTRCRTSSASRRTGVRGSNVSARSRAETASEPAGVSTRRSRSSAWHGAGRRRPRPEAGETLLTALGAVLDAGSRSRREDDDRTPGQRRADALGEICRQWLDLAERPSVAGERPHVTVTVDADAIQGGSSGTSEMDHVGPVDSEKARRLACDASVMRVVMRGRSEPLDVGRRTPVVPPAMRRAVIVRDRQCRFPRCGRPHSWCDAHHVVHWADGGSTALSNLVLLCRRHHRMVHRSGGFWLELLDGIPVFRRPDGSLLEDRAPP